MAKKDFKDYVGRLTPEETEDLALECLAKLTDEHVRLTLDEALVGRDQLKEEIMESWTDAESEGEF